MGYGECGVLNWKWRTESISSLEGHCRPCSSKSHIRNDQRPNLVHQSGEDPPSIPCLTLSQMAGELKLEREEPWLFEQLEWGVVDGHPPRGLLEGTGSGAKGIPPSHPAPGMSTGLRLTRLLARSICCWCRNTPAGGRGAVGGRCRQSSRVWCPRHLREGRKEGDPCIHCQCTLNIVLGTLYDLC